MKSTVKTRTLSRKPGDIPQPIGIKYSIILLLVLLGFIKLLKRSESQTLRELRKAQAPTLVTYIFSDTDPEYAENLRYFIREGITAFDDGCDYKIVIQVSDTEEELSPELVQDLEDLESYSNVEILEHKNECYDIGTIGWVYSLLGQRISKYSYFIWLNSSVRGPFLPSYLDTTYHWTRAFTGKLNDRIKLVGSTISCGMTGDHPPALHIQTYAVATDTVGVELLQRNDTIFKCYDTLEDVVFFSERGISETILNAGYSIDCLMSRYQGIDWQAARHMVDTYGCNGDLNPLQPGFYDGTDVDPMEVMFIKVKRPFLKAQWPSATKAEKLSLWKMETMTSNETEQIILSSANDWLDIRVGKLGQDARKRGMSCFDWEFYLDANKQDPLIDQDEENKEEASWEQFLEMGIYEGRPRLLLEKTSQQQARESTQVVEAVRKARQQINKLSKDAASTTGDTDHTRQQVIIADEEWSPREGESVFVPSIQAHAIVEKLGPGSQVTLRKGILTMQATIGQLEKAT